MEITATTLTQLRADKSYYLANSTGTIKEAGLWQRFKCWTGFGDGREKVRRLADAIKSALLADAFIKSEDKLSSELNGLDKNSSLSGADLRQIATRFKADHAQAIATSDAYRVADKLADEQIARWVKDGDVLPEKKSLEYMKKLALYAAQPVMDEALEYKDDPKKLARKLSRNIGQIIYCFASMENVKKSYFGYPRFDTYTAEDGKKHTLRVPRLRLDELHFRAVLSCLVTKDGPATFTAFTTDIFKLREEELQKRNATSANIAQLVFQANVSAMRIGNFGEALAMGTEEQKRKVMESIYNVNRIKNSLSESHAIFEHAAVSESGGMFFSF